jgi:SAM-dependent methyltransferase
VTTPDEQHVPLQGIPRQHLTRDLIQKRFRRLRRDSSSLTHQWPPDEMYDFGQVMAPGGLLLADMLAREMDIKPGDHVLDLGCGRGQSSIHLAKNYCANVTSLDLWENTIDRSRRAMSAGVADMITPLQGDILRGLPLEPGSLDAIFCTQAFHCFGTRSWLVEYLATLLRPGGRFGIAQGCFREEPAALPELFADSGGWHVEYDKYHSPSWWRRHFESSPDLKVTSAREVPQGDILWEDDILYRGDLAAWTSEYVSSAAWLIRHVMHGQFHAPTLTHCLIVSLKS